MMPASALEQVKDLTVSMTVNVIHTGEDGMPYYFLEEQPIGCAPYLDFDYFDPFKILGFTTVHHFIEPTDEQMEDHGDLSSRFAAAIDKSTSFKEALLQIDTICPGVNITQR